VLISEIILGLYLRLFLVNVFGKLVLDASLANVF
jgi:hypothetical protein